MKDDYKKKICNVKKLRR